MDFVSFRQRFNPAFTELLRARTAAAVSIYPHGEIADLVAYINTLATGGKRLRPYLAYLGYSAAGGVYDSAIERVAAGLELFHAFALIHDDIMDRDAERRGVKTLHVRAREMFGGNAHVGDAMGILAGDLVFEWARELLPDEHLAPYLSRMIDEVIIGQMLDVRLTTRTNVLREDLDDMMRLKTASYSFIRPLQIGGTLGGMKPDQANFFERFGQAFGLAFQLQDDYFDREADAARDRPSYYTRGYEKEGLAGEEHYFDEAKTLLIDAPLDDTVRSLFSAFLNQIRDRTK